MTSGWFRTMFKLPQPTSSTRQASSPETIALSEESSSLEPLLRMVCGLPVPQLTTWDEVDPILAAAEKYDCPGVHSIIRILSHTATFMDQPLRLYAAACRYGWHEEAMLAAEMSLVLDLNDPMYHGDLIKLRTPALLALQGLHRARLVAFREALNQPPFLTAAQMADTVSQRCSRCSEQFEYGAWRDLKYAMERELERRPMGDTVLNGLEDWPVAKICWSSQCKRPQCTAHVYDRVSSSRAIRETIEALPRAIEIPMD
ncbi:hypothetical protein PENSPDRAFT_656020 [Peniophora sp. CONT]|nr:hypothetical protein PENSPDRAFT_656020 [Peniophora sp. CONT]